MNNFYTYVIIFFAFTILSCVALGKDKVKSAKANFYIRNHYTFNVKHSDSFLNEYIDYGKGDYDFGISFGYTSNNKFSNEIELRHSSVVPSLSNMRDSEVRDLTNSLGKIIGEKVTPTRARRIFAVNRTALFLNYYYNHEINNDLSLILGGGIGVVAVLNYQGFKSYSETDVGLGAQFLFALNYKITEKFSLYSGYNYFANYWKYQTNPIPNENGHIVEYDFKDFEFNSHGISLGMMYKF